MTKRQFKEALLRGQGRCIKAVQFNPEKYYDIVLWACSHEVAFDPQCEGTRAWFVYQLISYYANKSPFIEAAITSVKKAKSNGGWKILYLAELLSWFANDGEEKAEQALWCKYQELYKTLLFKKELPIDRFSERDDFAMLCIVLASNKAAMLKIAEDIGKLYRVKSAFYDGWDFEWLFASKAKKYARSLKKHAIESENIAEYLRVSQETENSWESAPQEQRKDCSERMLSRWLKHEADSATIQEYANKYLEETEPLARAKALGAFCVCAFPNDPLPIIEDAKSDVSQLKEAAWRALENIRHPLVRTFALERLQYDVETAFSVFIANYTPQDEKMLVEIVMSIPIDFKCTTAWHGMQTDVLSMNRRGLKAPTSLLYYIYENTYCSCCRESALCQMGKQRVLTEEILEECLFDSNEDIRAYAKRRLKKRAKGSGILS